MQLFPQVARLSTPDLEVEVEPPRPGLGPFFSKEWKELLISGPVPGKGWSRLSLSLPSWDSLLVWEMEPDLQ